MTENLPVFGRQIMEDSQNNMSDKENKESKAETPSHNQTPIGTKPNLSRKLKRKMERAKKSRRRDPR